MPTERPRVTITLDNETLEQIDNFKFENRCKNQTQAILKLINCGLTVINVEQESTQKLSPTAASASWADSHPLVQIFNELNSDGQSALMEYAETLTYNPKYKKGDESGKNTA